MKDTSITPSARAAAREALLDHYDRAARDLPWRRDTDPYRVLVSEIMLQQTRVETVKGYYGPWIERFPTLGALADADEDDVLKEWEGLGYYRRARSLHRAARIVREKHGGVLPPCADALRELPGVGEYTSGAVASIAFGEPVPAVDGNVRRVMARLYDVAEPSARWLRDTAAAWVDEKRPGDWNQALMELGATVCTPRSPKCHGCPVAQWCGARAAGTVCERPAPTTKRAVPTADITLAVLHAEGRVLLEKRPADGLLGGMWAFPERRLEVVGGSGADACDAAVEVARAAGFEPASPPRPLPEIRHRFSHLDARYLPVAVRVDGAGGSASPAERVRGDVMGAMREGGGSVVRWVTPDDDTLALPVAQRRALESFLATLSGATTSVAATSGTTPSRTTTSEGTP